MLPVTDGTIKRLQNFNPEKASLDLATVKLQHNFVIKDSKNTTIVKWGYVTLNFTEHNPASHSRTYGNFESQYSKNTNKIAKQSLFPKYLPDITIPHKFCVSGALQ